MKLLRHSKYLLLIAFLFCFSAAGVFAQHTVRGTVTDASSSESLPGVNILVKGTSQGTSTNADGHYELQVSSSSDTLVFSFVGYESQEIPINGREEIDVNLQPQAFMGEDVVVVGYGTQQKVNLTGSVASVSTDEMAEIPVPTVTHALQGMAPGMQILDGGDMPGHNQLDVLVRGQGSLGRDADGSGDVGSADASRPLVLIDGIEGSLSDVDIGDVDNISVLKDAASAAIYGSRAANGVILVTTKRGSAGDLQVTYNGYMGTQDITAWPERVDTETHMRLANLARENLLNSCLDGREGQTEAECHANTNYAPRYTEEYIQNTLAGDQPDQYPDNELVDEIFNRAPIQDHSLRVSGGNTAARYSLSLNYMEEGGLMANTGTDRYGIRLNTDFQLNEEISGGLDLSANRSWDTRPAEEWASNFYIVHDTPPTVRTRFSDGTYGTNLFGRSALASAEVSGNEQRVFWDGTVTGRLNYRIAPWAEIQTQASFDYGSMDWELFRTDPDLIEEYPDDGYYWGPSYGENRTYTDKQTTLRALIDYDHTFMEYHNISGVVGYEQTESNFEEFRASRDQFYNNDLRQLDLGNETNDSNEGFGNSWALRSIFGRLNYELMDRYLFEFNARYDGSSRFAEGHRYGFFPSFSLGWRITEESFFNVDWVDELKIRGSWGQLGNQDVPLYSYYSSIDLSIPYHMGNASSAQSTGGAATALVNEELSWETTTVTNIGIDAAFLNNRLSVTGELYERRTEDILLALSVPDMVGLNAPFQNAGIVENKGWEVQVGWQDNIGEVSYGIDFNLSDNRNEVIDLVDTGPYIEGDLNLSQNVIQEGSPIGAWYGYETEGLYSSYQQIDSHADVPGEGARLGDIIFKDQNDDGIINDEDRVVIGDPNPHYIFGVNINAGWRNFDFTALLQGVGDREQYIGLGFAQGPVWENYTSEWHKDYWTPDNQDARHPAYYSNANRNYYNMNDWWILDGSFVKLRNVQLGYTLPQELVSRLGIQRLRLYATGKNLWMKNNLGIGLDPEYPWTTGDYYPQTKVISLGANISF
ncbi:TonB-linked outer membrane protein, SusC/RagA family [Fodinibius roseus]|uniref:TonB-linked outer membrane protein, SusC/RagA family n=1 Tax=Fodinibius roseus TaxID=1194090 RepID=A0A1M5D8H7_9BACT|nr:TonB-dependent receptor [Fodinibius roseus]SHF62972.1 TonB-linked outer membrane protein, SusC/RagA family [Fodinibius roseus]